MLILNLKFWLSYSGVAVCNTLIINVIVTIANMRTRGIKPHVET
jgi:hypothetical protein